MHRFLATPFGPSCSCTVLLLPAVRTLCDRLWCGLPYLRATMFLYLFLQTSLYLNKALRNAEKAWGDVLWRVVALTSTFSDRCSPHGTRKSELHACASPVNFGITHVPLKVLNLLSIYLAIDRNVHVVLHRTTACQSNDRNRSKARIIVVVFTTYYWNGVHNCTIKIFKKKTKSRISLKIKINSTNNINIVLKLKINHVLLFLR